MYAASRQEVTMMEAHLRPLTMKEQDTLAPFPSLIAPIIAHNSAREQLPALPMPCMTNVNPSTMVPPNPIHFYGPTAMLEVEHSMVMIKSLRSALTTMPTAKDTPAMLIPPKPQDYAHVAHATAETNAAK